MIQLLQNIADCVLQYFDILHSLNLKVCNYHNLKLRISNVLKWQGTKWSVGHVNGKYRILAGYKKLDIAFWSLLVELVPQPDQLNASKAQIVYTTDQTYYTEEDRSVVQNF